jgi:hypothetical protein
MGGDLADFRATLPERFAHDVMRALRQTFAAAIRYGYLTATRPQTRATTPPPRRVRFGRTRSPNWTRSRLNSAQSTGRWFRWWRRPGRDRSRRRCSRAATLIGRGAC